MSRLVMHNLADREKAVGPFATPEGTEPAWRHWQLRLDESKVAWLMFDCQGADVNVLSQAALTELNEVLMALEADKPRALVIRSAKASNFCVGADIKEFRHLESVAMARDKLFDAHAVANRLAALPFVTVAVVHGHCFGGGLELALACDYRIGIEGARLGFPEILLGLHPGLGGTGRSIALIDPIQAMTLMLTGKNVNAARAKKLGLIDALVPERHVQAALDMAFNKKLARKSPGFSAKLTNLAPVRRWVAKKMRAQAARKAPPEHYPAPEKLIQLWEQHGNHTQQMLTAEVDSFSELLLTEASNNLVRVFFLQEHMKKLAPKGQEPARHVHVVGAGAMGGDIAGWCALQGLTVTLFDMQTEIIAKAIGRTAVLCDKKRLNAAEKRAVLDRLIPDLDHAGAAHADVIIEAVPEKIEIKRSVYQTLEPKMKPGAILATNTSSIPLDELQQELQAPERLVGLHFFNPVAQMQLVEIVKHHKLSNDTYEKALAFTAQIKRLPTPVAGTPGFLVNRVLTPYLLEAMQLLDEGVTAETIDQAAEKFGMPMGPVELADVIGLDICQGVAEMLQARLDTPMPTIPEWLTQKVNAGDLGKKTGKGLYTWKDGKPQKKSAPAAGPEDLTDRLLLPMLNMCVTCLREEVIDSEELLDGAMIFGTGFAPFRGGPMHYLHSRGQDRVAASLDALASRHGERFKPDPWFAAAPHQEYE